MTLGAALGAVVFALMGTVAHVRVDVWLLYLAPVWLSPVAALFALRDQPYLIFRIVAYVAVLIPMTGVVWFLAASDSARDIDTEHLAPMFSILWAVFYSVVVVAVACLDRLAAFIVARLRRRGV